MNDEKRNADIGSKLPEPAADENVSTRTVSTDSALPENENDAAAGKLAAWLGLAITVVVCAAVAIMIARLGILESVEQIRGWVETLGPFGPVALVLVQVAQVVIRFVPGGVTCAASVLIFGPVWGFVISYVGLLIGCVLVYVLVRRYGINIAVRLVGRKNLEKYWRWTSGRHFTAVFAITAALPAFPDDIICVAAALAKVPFRKYFIICALGRSVGLVLYSLAGAGVFAHFGVDMLV